MYSIDVVFKMFSFRNKPGTEIVTPREDSAHTDHMTVRTEGARRSVLNPQCPFHK